MTSGAMYSGVPNTCMSLNWVQSLSIAPSYRFVVTATGDNIMWRCGTSVHMVNVDVRLTDSSQQLPVLWSYIKNATGHSCLTVTCLAVGSQDQTLLSATDCLSWKSLQYVCKWQYVCTAEFWPEACKYHLMRMRSEYIAKMLVNVHQSTEHLHYTGNQGHWIQWWC